jgi:hypothetical protein
MLPSDRPVIAEPEERRPATRPFAVTLGQAMHLNGTVPRGADLTHAAPRRYEGCGALYIVLVDAWRRRYCDACQAKAPCSFCNNKAGQHSATCRKLTRPPRLCRACRAPIDEAERAANLWYCPTCRAAECGYCHRYAGQHRRTCMSFVHKRTKGANPYVGLITSEMLRELYEAHRQRAVRLAANICGSEAEDIVQDVITYFLGRKDTLRHASRSLFLTAVKRAAVHRITYGWWRHIIPFDDEGMRALEDEFTREGRDLEVTCR